MWALYNAIQLGALYMVPLHNNFSVRFLPDPFLVVKGAGSQTTQTPHLIAHCPRLRVLGSARKLEIFDRDNIISRETCVWWTGFYRLCILIIIINPRRMREGYGT